MPRQLDILIAFILHLTCERNTGNTEMLSNLDDICATSPLSSKEMDCFNSLLFLWGFFPPKLTGGWPFAPDLLIKGKENLLCWNLLTAVLVLKPATACAGEACGPEARLSYRYSPFYLKNQEEL